jgi:hypothetical protein
VTSQYDQLNRRFESFNPGAELPAPIVPAPLPPAAQPPPETTPPAPSRFLVGEYDDERGAFVLVRPRDPQRVSFELRADLFTQARYSNFARSAET